MPERPFAPGCPPGSFLETHGIADALACLGEGLGAREPFLLVTGEPGTGKTSLAREAIRRWGDRVRVAWLAYPTLGGAQLLEEILLRFGAAAPESASRPRLAACLEQVIADVAGQGHVAMIVVDDAHAMPPESLDELRLLANAAQAAGHPLEVMLVGLNALEATLETPPLAALRQRVAARARLAPLSAGETRRYLRLRAGANGGDGAEIFPRAACLDLAALSGGVPRQVNALAAEALNLARAGGDTTVRPDHVQAAAEKLLRVAVAPRPYEIDEDDADGPATQAVPRATPTVERAAAPAAPVAAKAAAAAPGPAAPLAAAKAGVTAPKPAAPPAPVKAGPASPRPSTTPATPAAAKGSPALPHAAPPSTPAAATAPPPAPRAPQDPHEWVARFIGDRGPVQIGSQSAARSAWAPSGFAPEGGAEAPSAGSSAARHGPSAGTLPASRPRARHPRGARAAATSALMAIGVLALVALVMRAGLLAGHRAPAGASASSGAGARVIDAPDPPAVVPVTRGRAADTTSSRRPSAHTAAAAEPGGRGPFTLDVGGALDMDAALAWRDSVQSTVGIRAWVVPAPEGAFEPERIVLGVYRSRERADAAAEMLLRSRTLGTVTVVPLPPRRVRR